METKRTLIVPTVNLNGTSAVALIVANRAAISNLQTAMDYLTGCCPHGRDYQTMPPEAYGVARQQHVDRVLGLQQIIDELTDITLAIMGQGRKS